MTPKQIPFTIADAQSGKYKITTRDGRPVQILCTDLKSDLPIAARVTCSNCSDLCNTYTIGGFYRPSELQSKSDLILTEIPVWRLQDPPEGRQWHRGAEITEPDMQGGYRPLLEQETIHEEDQFWRTGAGPWVSYRDNVRGEIGSTIEPVMWKHRTTRPLPAEPAWWDCAEDVPMPICWIDTPHGNKSLVTHVAKEGVGCTGKSGGITFTWEQLKSKRHSTDGTNFKPCHKQ